MQALGFLLSALPSDEILGKLLSLVTPHIQQLEKLANEPVRSNHVQCITRVLLNREEYLYWTQYIAFQRSFIVNFKPFVIPYLNLVDSFKNTLFYPSLQPSSANKLHIVHILGLLSNLFSTFDLNKQNERLEVMNTVPTQPHNNNPVRHSNSNQLLLISKHVWISHLLNEQRFWAFLRWWLSCSRPSLWSRPFSTSGWMNWTWSRSVFVNVCVFVGVCGWFVFLSSQAVCAVFGKSLKTLLRDFAPLVTQLCELIGQMFSAYPQASALDLTRQVMT